MPAPKPTYIKINPPKESLNGIPKNLPNWFISCINGIMIVWNGISIVRISTPYKNLLNLLLERTNIHAVMALSR